MPLYEYYCPDCRTKFTALRSMKEADVVIACENCEGERPSRVLSVFAIHGKSGGEAVAEAETSSFGGGCACGGACGCGHH